MARKYYSLLQKENDLWNVQFGDYNREIVEQELDDMSYTEDIKRKDLKIICHKENETQTEVVNRTNEINKERLNKYIKSIKSKLKAENIDLQNHKKAVKCLENCVAPDYCIRIYENYIYNN